MKETFKRKVASSVVWSALPGGILEHIDSGFQIQFGRANNEDPQELFIVLYPGSNEVMFGCPKLEIAKVEAEKIIKGWQELQQGDNTYKQILSGIMNKAKISYDDPKEHVN